MSLYLTIWRCCQPGKKGCDRKEDDAYSVYNLIQSSQEPESGVAPGVNESIKFCWRAKTLFFTLFFPFFLDYLRR